MKKSIALLLASLLAVSAAPSAFALDYTDVPEGTELREAVEDLEALGIVNGYPDGSYRPEMAVTRAEMAVFTYKMSHAKGYTSPPFEGFSYFVDVSYPDYDKNHWAYYELAQQANKRRIGSPLEGYPDGTLRPDDKVTYTEALNMLLKELRYYDLIEENGGYPDGTMYWAEDLGLSEGMEFEPGDDTQATRGDIAIMVHRAMDAPYAKLFSEFPEGTTVEETEYEEGTFGQVDGEVIFTWGKGEETPRSSRDSNIGGKDYSHIETVVDG